MDTEKTTYHTKELKKAALRLIRWIRESDRVDESEIERSFADVMDQVKRTRARAKIRRITRWTMSAAAVIGICLALVWRNENKAIVPESPLALLNDTTMVSGDEVLLVMGDQTMNLRNEAMLTYDPAGNVDIREQATNQLAQVSPKKREMHKIIVPAGKRANIVFSDGTKMYINAGSKVVYPDVFDKEKREIAVEGEVYLDVAKNPDCPFIVQVKEFDIRVLGTSFNVSAYEQETTASVVLVHGSVLVTTKDKQEVRLKPNQLIDIKGNNTSISQVDVSEYISWKDDMLQVNKRYLTEIFKRLEIYYGCKIHADAAIASTSLTGKLDLLPTIEEVMDNLCFSFPIQYTIDQSKEIHVSLK